MALTGTLAAVHALRQRTHRKTAAILAPAVAGFAATAPVGVIGDAVDPDAPRNLRKAQAGLVIATALAQSPATDDWLDAITRAHVAATSAGAAAAAHHYSAGAVDLDPGDDVPGWMFDPLRDLDAQIDGLAGDIADLYSGVVDDAAIADALASGDGALYFGDVQTSDAFLDGSTAVYGELGVISVNWHTMAEACGVCLAIEAQNPYPLSSVPDAPHGGCRCWVEPA